MIIPKTVKEFLEEFDPNSNETDKTEIGYGDSGSAIRIIRLLMHSANIVFQEFLEEDKTIFSTAIETAIMAFQEKNGLKVTGRINDNTLSKLVGIAEEKAEFIYSEVVDDGEEYETAVLNNPHYGSFFSSANTKDARKNNQDIVISLGNGSVVKTIHNVYMRGVSTEYDTSGNPISETYEFVAQDLTESDENRDKDKYS